MMNLFMLQDLSKEFTTSDSARKVIFLSILKGSNFKRLKSRRLHFQAIVCISVLN